MMALLAVAGAPPFGLFFSELHVATRGFQLYGFGMGFIFLMTIAIVFTGLIYFAGKMYFSDLPSRFKGGETLTFNHLLILLPVCLLIFQGLYMPQVVQELLQSIVNSVLHGGGLIV
jgi:hydrogenase-4 component F